MNHRKRPRPAIVIRCIEAQPSPHRPRIDPVEYRRMVARVLATLRRTR